MANHKFIGFHDGCLLGFYTTEWASFVLVFQRNVLPPSERVNELVQVDAKVLRQRKCVSYTGRFMENLPKHSCGRGKRAQNLPWANKNWKFQNWPFSGLQPFGNVKTVTSASWTVASDIVYSCGCQYWNKAVLLQEGKIILFLENACSLLSMRMDQKLHTQQPLHMQNAYWRHKSLNWNQD